MAKKETAGPKPVRRDEKTEVRTRRGRGTGTGALCAEAQADGVPCFELGRECATCERARGSHERS